MIGNLTRQASLLYFAFAKEVSAIKDVTLDEIDALLQDPELLELTSEKLGGRCLRSKDFGRPGIAPDRLLRWVVLKHLKSWSFRELEYELRHSLLYRRFTRFFEDPIPDFTSFSRTFALFGPEGTRLIHQRVVEQAKEKKLVQGRKLRIDATAVETNIHYPTDSSLLGDSLRVMTRCLKRIAAGCADQSLKIVDHARAAKYRLLEICRAAKSFTRAGRARCQSSYGKLLALSRQVRRQAGKVLEDLSAQRLKIVLPAAGRLWAKRAQHQKQRWFHRGQGWRAGVEPRISTLKHQFGMKRARYKGDAGFQRSVGWCIIVQDLVAMARSQCKRKAQCRSG